MRTFSLVLFAAAVSTSVSAWPAFPGFGPQIDTRSVPRSSLSYVVAKRQTTCTGSCTAADSTTLGEIENCQPTAANYVACTCSVINSLSPACLTCILTADGETSADFNEACAELGTLSATGPTLTATGASPTATTPTCGTQCSDSSDLNALSTLGSCDETDPTCVCPATNALSPACFTCFLASEDVTQSQLDAFCETANSTATVVAGGSTISVTVPATASTTPTSSPAAASSPSAPASASGSAASPATTTKSGAVSIQSANVGLIGFFLAGLIAIAASLL